MNRTGLFIALALALVIGLLFGIYPELDLKLAALFYDPATKSFPLKFNALAAIARDGAMWISWGLALPAIVALVIKLARPDRPLLMSGRAIVFLLVTLIRRKGWVDEVWLMGLLAFNLAFQVGAFVAEFAIMTAQARLVRDVSDSSQWVAGSG